MERSSALQTDISRRSTEGFLSQLDLTAEREVLTAARNSPRSPENDRQRVEFLEASLVRQAASSQERERAMQKLVDALEERVIYLQSRGIVRSGSEERESGLLRHIAMLEGRVHSEEASRERERDMMTRIEILESRLRKEIHEASPLPEENSRVGYKGSREKTSTQAEQGDLARVVNENRTLQLRLEILERMLHGSPRHHQSGGADFLLSRSPSLFAGEDSLRITFNDLAKKHDETLSALKSTSAELQEMRQKYDTLSEKYNEILSKFGEANIAVNAWESEALRLDADLYEAIGIADDARAALSAAEAQLMEREREQENNVSTWESLRYQSLKIKALKAEILKDSAVPLALATSSASLTSTKGSHLSVSQSSEIFETATIPVSMSSVAALVPSHRRAVIPKLNLSKLHSDDKNVDSRVSGSMSARLASECTAVPLQSGSQSARSMSETQLISVAAAKSTPTMGQIQTESTIARPQPQRIVATPLSSSIPNPSTQTAPRQSAQPAMRMQPQSQALSRPSIPRGPIPNQPQQPGPGFHSQMHPPPPSNLTHQQRPYMLQQTFMHPHQQPTHPIQQSQPVPTYPAQHQPQPHPAPQSLFRR